MDYYWKFRPQADSLTFCLLAQCLADIAESVTGLNDKCRREAATGYSFQKSARDISVAIHKVLLDKGGHVLKNCVVPRFHSLRTHMEGTEKQSVPDVIVESMGGMSVYFTVGGSDSESSVTTPPYEHRTVVINPLYGLRRTGEKQYQLEDPFDWTRETVGYGKWLKTRVLEVGGVVLTAENILYLMRNYEGAHVELNEMVRRNTSMPIDVKMPDNRDELYRRGNWVLFSGASYLHIFTILVGIYLVNMMKGTLIHAPDEVTKMGQVTHAARAILRSPWRLASPTMLLQKDFSIGAVFDNTSNQLEVVGDYEKAGSTRIQIPD